VTIIEAEDEVEFEARDEEDALTIALDGFEGPLHLLLELARAKKIDLKRISIAELAEQCLSFIADARRRRLDLAGDYLVMAAWLALLKSRLILPQPQPAEDAASPEELVEALRLKLLRLAETRAAAKRLLELPQLGVDVFPFGDPHPVAVTRETKWRADLMEMLAAYCREATRHVRRAHKLEPRRAYSVAEARRRLEKLLQEIKDWRPIEALAPAPQEGPTAPPPASYVASLLGAALELAREGRMELKQSEAFSPLYLRARRAKNAREAKTAPS
jgi:segregation and condensation protein A